MTLTESTDNSLYYNCVEKHEKHAFRYNIDQKKWEKIILKTKRILNYNEDPIDNEPQITTTPYKAEETSKPIQPKEAMTQS
jgi:hypothetical protein